MTCPHCHQPEADHTEVVADDGRVKRYCPSGEPVSGREAAKAHIAAIRRQLREEAS